MKNKKNISNAVLNEIKDTNLAKDIAAYNNACETITSNLQTNRFISLVTPNINRKVLELKEKRKRKMEWAIMLFAYIIVIPFILMLALDYIVNGWEGMLDYTILIIGFLSLLLFAYIPLMKKFIEMKKY